MIKKIARKIAGKSSSTKKTAKKTTSTSSKKRTSKKISMEDLDAMIAKKAFELFEERGYSHGSDQGDWYEAEKLVRTGLK